MEAIGLKNDVVKLQQILGSKLYSSKYSFIVEVLQNSTDSMRKAGKANEAFEVGIDNESNFYVRDYGASFDNKEDIVKYLCTLLESSKTQSKDDEELQEIGKYGIGKISSAAFNNSWNYKIYKNKKGIDLKVQEIDGKGIFYDISEYYDTEEVDGVHYSIKINENIRVFVDNLLKKACYFQNIRFNFPLNILNVIGNDKLTINDDFKLIKSDSFQHSTLSKFNTMHICLDQYAYPINWSELGIEPIPLNLGLRFGLNELDVNPTREAITISSDYTEKVTNKINEALEWFRNKYNEEHPVITYTKFNEFDEALKDSKHQIIKLDEGIQFSLTAMFDRFNLNLNKPLFEGVDTPFYMWYLTFMKSNINKILRGYLEVKSRRSRRNPYYHEIHTSNNFIADCTISKLKQDYLRSIMRQQNVDYIRLVKDEIKYDMWYIPNISTTMGTYYYSTMFDIDKTAYETLDSYKDVMDNKIKQYHICLDRMKEAYYPKLSQLKVPIEFHNIKEKEKVAVEKGQEETIMVKIPRAPKVYKHGVTCIFEDIVFHIKDAYKIPRFHIYGVEEDREKLISLWSKINLNKIQILLLTEKNKKIVENLELHNFINVNSLKDKLGCVATYITAFHIEKKLDEYSSICDKKGIIEKFLDSKFGKDLKELIDFQEANCISNVTGYGRSSSTAFINELYQMFLDKPVLFKSDWYEKLNRVLADIEKFNFVEMFGDSLDSYERYPHKHAMRSSAIDSINAMRDLCRYRGKKMDWQHYKPFVLENKENIKDEPKAANA